MNDYKTYLEKFVADIQERLMKDDEIKESLNIITKKYNKVLQELENLSNRLNEENPVKLDDPIIDNPAFIKLMGISSKTAQSWRDDGIVSFSQIGLKIYYRASDIKKLLDHNYRKSTKNLVIHEK